MKFRRNFFTLLFLGAALWTCAGLSSINQTVTTTTAGTVIPGVTHEAAYRAGQTIGNAVFSGLGVGMLVCTGVLPGFVFLFFAWRNHVGLGNRNRHEELLSLTRNETRPSPQ